MTATPAQDHLHALRVRGGTGRVPTWLEEIADGHRSPAGSFDQTALTASDLGDREEYGEIRMHGGDRRTYPIRRRQFLDIATAIAERDARIERIEADRVEHARRLVAAIPVARDWLAGKTTDNAPAVADYLARCVLGEVEAYT